MSAHASAHVSEGSHVSIEGVHTSPDEEISLPSHNSIPFVGNPVVTHSGTPYVDDYGDDSQDFGWGDGFLIVLFLVLILGIWSALRSFKPKNG